MFKIFRQNHEHSSELLASMLCDENTFYSELTRALKQCQHEVIIESPFVINRRLGQLLPALERLKSQNVRVVISTRDPAEHDDEYACYDARQAIARLQYMGVHILNSADT
jgi:phosphatidylserine/phosphatidylglycerophosphate/cardiolipin synthase-like enzyme